MCHCCGILGITSRLFLNGAYFENPDPEVRKFIDYIRTLDGRVLSLPFNLLPERTGAVVFIGRADVSVGVNPTSMSAYCIWQCA